MTESQPGPSAPVAKSPNSALAAIAKRHEKLRQQKTLDLKVPGYEDLMEIRYRLLPEAEMDRLAKRLEEVKDAGIVGSWEAEADTLVALCDRILVRESAEDSLQTLEDDNGPIKFGASFAKAMSEGGVNVSDGRARESVLDFFSPRSDPSDKASARLFPNAMERHVNAILAWNRNQRDLIARDLLGG